MRPPARPRRRQMQEIVSEACGLIHHDAAVRSVHIVGGERPDFEQLRRYRKTAIDDHVRLTVERDGVITILPDVQKRVEES